MYRYRYVYVMKILEEGKENEDTGANIYFFVNEVMIYMFINFGWLRFSVKIKVDRFKIFSKIRGR